jgi:HYR domain
MRGVIHGSIAVVAAAAALALAPAASPVPVAANALELRAEIPMNYDFGPFCTPEMPAGIECVRFQGRGGVPGLGEATLTYVKGFEPVCADATPVRQFRRAVLDVAGKGTIEVVSDGVLCSRPAPSEFGPVTVAVTGGTGRYAGASGRLEYQTSVYAARACRGGLCGAATDRLSGTLNVPGLDFDTTGPVLTGTRSRVVRAAKQAKRVRVRYTVSASDEVDGAVTAACKPSSGSAFRVGRTPVTCTATDGSANTSRATFTVTVKRRT